MTITEFLEARIAEDEAVARAAFEDGFFGEDKHDKGEWEANTSSAMPNVEGAYMGIMVSDELGSMNREQAFHIARNDPARVLAECAAKRAIIARAPRNSDPFDIGYYTSAHTVRALAAIYADHPDYNPEWKP